MSTDAMSTIMGIPIAGLLPVLAPVTEAHLGFKILREIGQGQGGNSTVFLALDLQLDTQLAIKRVEKTRIPNPAEFFTEARRLYEARHRNVVEVKYACYHDAHIYIAMPYYQGGSLQDMLDTRFLTVRDIVRYGLEFLAGLHHAHVRGIVHFDIKPTNVLLDASNTAMLADFGLSQDVAALGLAEMPCFYYSHMPPERALSTMVSKTADVYQAGVTLYRMCVGNEDYARQLTSLGSTAALVSAIGAGTFPNRKRYPAHIPSSLRNVIKKALQVRAEDRYATVLDLMNGLARVNESLDWTYTSNGQWGEGQWHFSDGARSRVLTFASVGNASVLTAEHVSADGRARRCSKFCVETSAPAESLRLLSRALTEPWR